MHITTIFTTVLLSVSALALSNREEAQPKYFKLNAHKSRKSSFDNVYYDDVQNKFFKRDNSSKYFNLDLNHERTFYSTEIEIGSPPQKVRVMVDTGSSDLWVVGSDNSICEAGTTGSLNKMGALNDLAVQHKPAYSSTDYVTSVTLSFPNYGTEYETDIKPTTFSQSASSTGTIASLIDVTYTSSSSSSSSSSSTIDCSIYGTFDSGSSDTFVSNDTAFYMEYVDRTYARGFWGHDDISMGDYNITGLSFAVCNDTNDSLGILGIGLSSLEATYSSSRGIRAYGYKYENLPLKLKSDGFINMAAYSIYLNSNKSDEASVLFGAIDHNKYTGDLVALPIVNTVASYGYDDPVYPAITLNTVNIVNTKLATEATIASGAVPALLDTGSTISYAPYDVYDEIVSTLPASYSSSVNGYTMSCSNAEKFTMNFNFQGKEIKVPLSSFMIPLTSSHYVTTECMLGMLPTWSNRFMLGDNFIRNVYMINDFENYEIILGDINQDDQENIEVFNSTIPNVASTASLSIWSTTSQSLTVPSHIETRDISISHSSIGSVSSISSTDSKNGANGKYTDTNAYGFTTSFLFFIISLL